MKLPPQFPFIGRVGRFPGALATPGQWWPPGLTSALKNGLTKFLGCRLSVLLSVAVLGVNSLFLRLLLSRTPPALTDGLPLLTVLDWEGVSLSLVAGGNWETLATSVDSVSSFDDTASLTGGMAGGTTYRGRPPSRPSIL